MACARSPSPPEEDTTSRKKKVKIREDGLVEDWVDEDEVMVDVEDQGEGVLQKGVDGRFLEVMGKKRIWESVWRRIYQRTDGTRRKKRNGKQKLPPLWEENNVESC